MFFENLKPSSQSPLPTTAATAASKSWEIAATETASFAKKRLDSALVLGEGLYRATKLEEIMEAQSQYFKTALTDYLTQAGKWGELCSTATKAAHAAQNASNQQTERVATAQNNLPHSIESAAGPG